MHAVCSLHCKPAGWCTQAMSQIVEALPALRFDADSVVYNNGSKQRSSIIDAWVQLSIMAEQALSLCDPASPRRTPVRAELAAALQSPSSPLDQPLTIMTDRLTSHQLIAAHLVSRETQPACQSQAPMAGGSHSPILTCKSCTCVCHEGQSSHWSIGEDKSLCKDVCQCYRFMAC